MACETMLWDMVYYPTALKLVITNVTGKDATPSSALTMRHIPQRTKKSHDDAAAVTG